MVITVEERRNTLELFNVSEAARKLGIPVQGMHRKIRAGELPGPEVRLGRRRYYPKLKTFVDRQRTYVRFRAFISLHAVQVVEAAEPPRQRQPETMQQHRLGFVRFRHAAKGNLSLRSTGLAAGSKRHVTAFDLRNRFDHRSRGVAASRPLRRYQPTRNAVAAVMDALKAVTNRPSSLEMPCWLTAGANPSEVIAFDNGLLDVETFLSTGHTELLGHTPDWFSCNCLPHGFDPDADCSRWIAFLEQVFDGDDERIASLQQWFGYNLVADNRQHKLAMLIGPPRSGKGTTMAVLSALLGKHNIASTSLASLGGRFGLEPLVGKLAALIDEGHLGKFSDTSLVLERLKAISGGSEQTVDRKGLAALSSVALKVRFTIALNELPRLSDASAALRSRLLVLPYFNSYEGKEDFSLVEKLLKEVPGITNWALAGLRDLRKAGRFHNPKAGEKILRDFVYLSSPIQAFLDECGEVGDGKEVRRDDLQLAWRVWCDENGHMAGSLADFGRKLRAAVPRIDDEQRRQSGQRIRWYTGVGLTPDTLADTRGRRQGVVVS